VTDSSSAPAAQPAPKIDTTVPHSARIWNYWLGGKDNYAVDREAGDQFLSTFPDIAVVARATRAFQGRAVRYLASEAQIRQFPLFRRPGTRETRPGLVSPVAARGQLPRPSR
jgi:S-adenosyl methyltransferase